MDDSFGSRVSIVQYVVLNSQAACWLNFLFKFIFNFFNYLYRYDILSIISALNDEFDVSIPAKDVIPENFNSAAAMRDLIQRLVDED